MLFLRKLAVMWGAAVRLLPSVALSDIVLQCVLPGLSLRLLDTAESGRLTHYSAVDKALQKRPGITYTACCCVWSQVLRTH